MGQAVGVTPSQWRVGSIISGDVSVLLTAHSLEGGATIIGSEGPQHLCQLGLHGRGGRYQCLNLAQPSLRILAVGGIEAVSTRSDASQPNDLLACIQVTMNSTELVDRNNN